MGRVLAQSDSAASATAATAVRTHAFAEEEPMPTDFTRPGWRRRSLATRLRIGGLALFKLSGLDFNYDSRY